MKNTFRILGEVAAILLEKKNGVSFETIIDTADLEKAESFPNKWQARIGKRSPEKVYAGAHVRIGNNRKKVFLLHRFITNAPDGVLVDHKNHNTLDNRRSNLRFTNHSGNAQNLSKVNKNNTSGIRSVFFHKPTGQWKARVRIKGVRYNLGTFQSKEAARDAVLARLREVFGDAIILSAKATGLTE